MRIFCHLLSQIFDLKNQRLICLTLHFLLFLSLVALNLPLLIKALTIVVFLDSDDVLDLDSMFELCKTLRPLPLLLLLIDAGCSQVTRRVYRIFQESLLARLLCFTVQNERLVVLEDICDVVLAEDWEHNVKLLPGFLLWPRASSFNLRLHLLEIHRAHLVEWQERTPLII